MSIDGRKIYPGAAATPKEVLLLAAEYRRAAEALRPTGRRRRPVSWAPYRLVAIHAVELYLNALLLAAGHGSGRLRGLQHDLASRTRLAVEAKLGLRRRTLDHLHSLSDRREYLVSRYDPAGSAASEITRLAATLHEVADKVADRIGRAAQ